MFIGLKEKDIKNLGLLFLCVNYNNNYVDYNKVVNSY